jgi:DNA-binding NarL/FixJ family response regulator
VGRDEELARIRSLVARRRGVLLAGPPGAGKTRLVQEALADVGEGVETLTIVASRASAEIPLGCCSALLASGDAGDATAALVAVRRGIVTASGGHPLVLAVDDAQWLDGATAALVHQLVAEREVTLLASIRDEAEAPEPIMSLWKDGLVERIELAPLPQDAIVELLEQVLGRQVERAGALRLAARSGGNALFLRELVDVATRLDLVEDRDGVLLIHDPPARSPRLAQLVASHIGEVSAANREALELVALAEPISLAALHRLSPDADVEALEQQGLVSLVVDGGRELVRLGHPLYGDVIREQLAPLRRRRLLLALADDLEERGSHRRGDSLRLALLRLDAGDSAPPAVLVAAATEAFDACAGPTAERLAREAHRAAPSFETAVLLVRILFELGRREDLEAVIAEAAALAADDGQRAFVAVSTAGARFWGLADGDGARAALAHAEHAVTTPAAHAELRATRALYEANAGNHRSALTLVDSIDLEDPASARGALQASLAASLSLTSVGRADDAVAVVDRALRTAGEDRELLTLYTRGLLEAAKGSALVALGRLDDAAAVADAGYESAIAAREASTQAFFAVGRGWIDLHRGQLNQSIRSYREAAVTFAAQSHPGPARWALGGLLLAAGYALDREVAELAARSLAAMGDHPAGMYDVVIGRARAWAALADNEPMQARSHLAAAAELARRRDLPFEEACCLHDSVRLGDAAEVAPRLAEVAERCAGQFVAAMSTHARGVAAGDLQAIEEAVEAFDTMGFLLKAAEAAMAGSEVAARAGDQRRSSRLAERGRELVGRCETPSTPMLLTTPGPVPLTNREREVATLAAAGMTSRAIGERLFLSARTVENHLAKIYAKCGVSGRRELAEALA